MERGIAVQAHRLGRTNVADRAGKKVEACASSHLTTDEVQKMMERILQCKESKKYESNFKDDVSRI